MKRLVVVYDVSEFSAAEIENLEVAAIVQAESESGDRSHPAARVRSRVLSDPIEVEAIDRRLRRGDDVAPRAIPGQLEIPTEAS